jgi:hypothetical protein
MGTRRTGNGFDLINFEYLSSDHDPLFRFHRWLANLRDLDGPVVCRMFNRAIAKQTPPQ